MNWAAPLLAALGAITGSILASLRTALLTVARGEVEQARIDGGGAAGGGGPRSGWTAGQEATEARVRLIMADRPGHARSVGVFMLLCDMVVVGALIFWVAQIRSGQGDPLPGVIDVMVGAAVALVVLWLTGVALPMSVAEHAGAGLIRARSGMVRAMHLVMSPLEPVGRFIDELVRRLVGAPITPPEQQMQAELMSVVEEGQSIGALDDKSRIMIEAIMKFPTRTVEEIMTPRTEVQALEYTNNLGAIIQTIKRIGHSRIPVYEDNLDHITGIFYVKDLMKWLAGEGTHGGGKPFELKSILRAPVVVPWSKTVRELLDEMIGKKVHIALVADEYGGTAGLVTIEDVFEEIVGDIKDEYEPGPAETPEVVLREDERRAQIDASARIDAVNDALAPLGVEIPESEEYDTVGGFVITTLGRIPAKGDTFAHGRMAFTILEARPTKVVSVRLEVRPPEEHGAEGDGEGGAGEDGLGGGGEGDPHPERAPASRSQE